MNVSRGTICEEKKQQVSVHLTVKCARSQIEHSLKIVTTNVRVAAKHNIQFGFLSHIVWFYHYHTENNVMNEVVIDDNAHKRPC